MAWFFLIVLTVIVVLSLLAVLILAGYVSDEQEFEQARIDAEVRRAERRLHEIASRSFEAMMVEARMHDSSS